MRVLRHSTVARTTNSISEPSEILQEKPYFGIKANPSDLHRRMSITNRFVCKLNPYKSKGEALI